jgi:hypothetical protein
MRPAVYHRESCPPAEQPGESAAPCAYAARRMPFGANTAPDFATHLAQAPRDVRDDPAQSAMLLRSWMSGHG